MSYPNSKKDSTITAVLGPTNTGKTHYAIERMLSFKSGMIGLPLRLLAREIYDRIIARLPSSEVALVTGEEKIIPKKPRFWICTVEAMPLSNSVEFMAIDEIQLSANAERGRTFTSRLLYARGRAETLFLGSDSMAAILRNLFPNIQFLGRERFSVLSYKGAAKVTRLPRRSAIVAFSASAVYEIAELVRRQRGGAAVVLGALSPRTRNAQAALYQEGEVDYLIATDAIGMGLNMDIDHVAFAGCRKFDGRQMRDLRSDEVAQIAGRAGRYLSDGTFGVTATCPVFNDEMINAIEEHQFDSITGLFWRAENLEFTSVPALLESLNQPALRREFIRARPDDDERALEFLLRDDDIRLHASGGAALALLWDVCQIPDFQKSLFDQHAKFLSEIYLQLIEQEQIREDYLKSQIDPLDRTDGDIDLLSTRLANIRSWTYLSSHSHWVKNARYWQERARTIEDNLSDALHERLTQRFVDRRTAVLLKRLKDDTPLLAGVTEDGEVIVEGQFIGRLLGFEFIIDPRASSTQAKPVRAAAERALRPVLAARASALTNAQSDELTLTPEGILMWRASAVARLEKGPAALRPNLILNNLDMIPAVLRGRIEDRLKDYIVARIEAILGPLIALQQACESTQEETKLDPTTRGVAYRLVENFGATSRNQFGDELKQLNQDERAKLRRLGLRFGEFTLFMPALLKPAPASLLTLLWALWNEKSPSTYTPPKAGLVSSPMIENTPHAYYYASGYRPSGTRAVRIDMLERLAGEVRTTREKYDRREGFEANAQMMSLVGCSGEEFEAILMSLGFRKNTVKRKKSEIKTEETNTEPKTSETPKVAETSKSPKTETPDNTKDNSDQSDGSALLNKQTAQSAKIQDTPSNNEGEISSQISPSQSEHIITEGSKEESVSDNKTPATSISADNNRDQNVDKNAEPKAEGESGEEIEVTLWRFQAKRPRHHNKDKPARSSAKNFKNRKSSDASSEGKKTRGSGPNKRNKKANGHGDKRGKPYNAPSHKPRHLKQADPDSPFAVLAALKTDEKK